MERWTSRHLLRARMARTVEPAPEKGISHPTRNLKSDVFPAFQAAIPKLSRDEYALEEFLEIINTHLELRSVSVGKEPFHYMVNDTICEVANVAIDNTTVATVSTESTEIPDILQTIEDIGLGEFEKINYLQAIKRIICWINKPLAN